MSLFVFMQIMQIMQMSLIVPYYLHVPYHYQDAKILDFMKIESVVTAMISEYPFNNKNVKKLNLHCISYCYNNIDNRHGTSYSCIVFRDQVILKLHDCPHFAISQQPVTQWPCIV